ncbi:MAG: hypothetical protein ACETWB_03210 [Anaerolineae bacterium]
MLRVNVILERLDMLGEYLEFLNSQQGVTYEKLARLSFIWPKSG